MKFRKLTLMTLVAVMVACFTATLAVTASADGKKYYSYQGTTLTEFEWNFDSNGIETGVPSGGLLLDEEGNQLASNYGMYAPSSCYQAADNGSRFVLIGTYFMRIGKDITPDLAINIDTFMDPNGSWSTTQGLGRFSVALFADPDELVAAGNNGWNPDAGSKDSFTVDLGTEYGHRNQVRHDDVDGNENYSEPYKFLQNNARITLNIAEEQKDSFIALNGVIFSTLKVSKDDFPQGVYMSLIAVDSVPMEYTMKVSQSDLSATVTLKSNESAFEEQTVKTEICRELDLTEYATDIEGYTFEGWYSDEACIHPIEDNKINVAGDTTVYAKYHDESATYRTVTFTTDRGDFEDVEYEVKDGDNLSKVKTVFVYPGFTQEWQHDGAAYDMTAPVNENLTLNAVWVEEPLVLYHKMHGVVDKGYRYTYDYDANGWDKDHTSYEIGDTFVDENGNEVITSWYGCYNPDLCFLTRENGTNFVLSPAGSITNHFKLDLTKKIVITYNVNNWDLPYRPDTAEGSIAFELVDSIYAGLRAGHAATKENRDYVKAAIATSTTPKSEYYGSYYDPFNPKATTGRQKDLEYYDGKEYLDVIEMFISENGDENYVSVNGTRIDGALAGVKRSDFIGGYAYLHIANTGSTHNYFILVSQESQLTLKDEHSEYGSYTASKSGSILFGESVTLTITPNAGYTVKSVHVGDREFLADANNLVTFTKGWNDEEVVVEFAKAVTLTFETNGAGTIAPQTVCEGDSFYKPSNPKREGYKFAGWYTDAGCTQEYKFSTPATADLTIYAKWEKEEAEGGGCSGAFGVGAGFSVILLALGAVKLRKKNG